MKWNDQAVISLSPFHHIVIIFLNNIPKASSPNYFPYWWMNKYCCQTAKQFRIPLFGKTWMRSTSRTCFSVIKGNGIHIKCLLNAVEKKIVVISTDRKMESKVPIKVVRGGGFRYMNINSRWITHHRWRANISDFTSCLSPKLLIMVILKNVSIRSIRSRSAPATPANRHREAIHMSQFISRLGCE